MKRITDMTDHKQRFIRSFLLAVLLIAVGAALGYCQVPTIQGEVHHDNTPEIKSEPADFIEPMLESKATAASIVANDEQNNEGRQSNTEQTIWNSASFQSVLAQVPEESTKTNNSGLQDWHSFVDDAKKKSAKTSRPVMLLFTGSDWCLACRRLETEILKTPTFAAWSNRSVIKVEVNFPRSYQLPAEIAKQNEELRRQYAPYLTTGFPVALFIDADGNVLGKNRYTPNGVDAWIDNAENSLRAVRQFYGESVFN